MSAVFTVQGHAMINGIPADGLTCDAFLEERWFPSSSPSLNTPLPGAPDATTVSGGSGGGLGTFLMTVPQSGSYWIAAYQPAAPAKIAWEKVLSHPHTAWQGWTAAGDQTANRDIATTTLVIGGGGTVVLPTPTIGVISTSGFASSGYLLCLNENTSNTYVAVQYTGYGANQFTGCTGGTGAVIEGGDLVCQGYVNGPYRRIVTATMNLQAPAAGDTASGVGITTIGGNCIQTSAFLLQNESAGTIDLASSTPIVMFVDPLGAYGIQKSPGGTGAVSLQQWIEADF